MWSCCQLFRGSKVETGRGHIEVVPRVLGGRVPRDKLLAVPHAYIGQSTLELMVA